MDDAIVTESETDAIVIESERERENRDHLLESPLPGEVEKLDEKVPHQVAQPVVAPAGGPQLLHGCVDEGKSSAALLPALEEVLVVAPRDGTKVLQERPLVRKRVVEENVPRVLPVAELLREGVVTLDLPLVARGRAQLLAHRLEDKVDARNGNFPVVEVWAQLGRTVRVHSGLLLLEKRHLLVQKLVPNLHGRVGTGEPLILQVVARFPLLLGENVEGSFHISIHRLIHRGQRNGPVHGQKGLVGHLGRHVLPKGLEGRKGRPLLVQDLPRLIHQVGPKALHPDVHALEERSDALVLHQ
mmetsp:Transcript_33448/g.72205  ORF Transcript_33448/g.72205 Transcript_33448/m.72205 type:complete len:300 (-) Transcript_33448:702-1601(-)